MEDIIPYVVWAAILIAGAISSINKAKQKKEAMQRKADNTPTSSSMPSPQATKPGSGRKLIHKSLAEVLEELANKDNTIPSSTAAPRPVATPTADWPVFGKVAKPVAPPATEPAATSHDYYSLEGEYDAADGRGYRESYNAETGSYSDDVSTYEGLAAERARRTTYSGTAAQTADAQSGGVQAPSAGKAAENDTRRRNADNGNTLEEILDGDFDLRRAVIEAEILTPKYSAGGGTAKYF